MTAARSWSTHASRSRPATRRASAYQIDSGRLIDVVAFRPYDRTGDWWIYPQGYPAIEAQQATMVALRFDESAFSDEAIRAGLLGGGGKLYCDGHLVAALSGDRGFDPVVLGDGRLRLGRRGCDAGVLRASDAARRGERSDPPFVAGRMRRGGRTDPGCAGFRTRCGWGRRSNGADAAGRSRSESTTPQGRLLRTIESGDSPGGLSVQWDGRTSDGEAIPTGLYLLRIRQGGSAWDRRVVILR